MHYFRKNRRWHIVWGSFLLFLPLMTEMPLFAKDAYDMGQVQVVGKDAQEEDFKPDPQEISEKMGTKEMFLPESPPPRALSEPKPMSEKGFEIHAAKTPKGKMTLDVGLGTRNTRNFRFQGNGNYDGYQVDGKIIKEKRDGFRSSTSDEHNQIGGSLKSSIEGNYEFTLDGDLAENRFGLGGTSTQPTPSANIKDMSRGFGVSAHTTMKDGAFVSGNAHVESITRKTWNSPAGFSEESNLYSGKVGGEYMVNMKKDLTGKATLGLSKQTYGITNGPEADHSKRHFGLTAEYAHGDKSFVEFGFKSLALMDKDEVCPVFRFDYRWSKPWQAVLAYDEDLGNDELKNLFLPRRYVTFSSPKASWRKRSSGRLNYRWDDRANFGVELFNEKEIDALQFLDRQSAGSGLLVSDLAFAGKARRKGISLGGQVKLDSNFSLAAATTFQDPTDDSTGQRLSYEAKRLLNVTFSYRSGSLEADYSREAQFRRVAYIPLTQVDPGDYSRADLMVRYKIRPGLRAYAKIKDLYDDAKQVRYNVPEEGRVTTAGFEADF